MKDISRPDTESASILDLNTALPVNSSSHKPRGKPFAPGNQHSKGRPRGSRNKNKLLFEEMMQEYGRPFVRKLIKMALEGDRTAVKLVAERTIPLAQDDRMELRLPAIRTAADLPKVSSIVIQAVARGDISIEHAHRLTGMIEVQRRLIESEELERRLTRIEQRGPSPVHAPALEQVSFPTDLNTGVPEETSDAS